jgi:hypothetical protein
MADDYLFPAIRQREALAAQIACVAREVKMRERVYPRRVGSGHMSQGQADRELAAMQSVLATLEGLRDG